MVFQDDPGMTELAALRHAELREAESRAADSFEAYWAGSASASVLRDYAAGRVVMVPAPGRRRSGR